MGKTQKAEGQLTNPAKKLAGPAGKSVIGLMILTFWKHAFQVETP
jgi:hypothetical protein